MHITCWIDRKQAEFISNKQNIHTNTELYGCVKAFLSSDIVLFSSHTLDIRYAVIGYRVLELQRNIVATFGLIS